MNRKEIYDTLLQYDKKYNFKIEESDEVSIAKGNSYFSPDEKKMVVPSQSLIFESNDEEMELYYFSTFIHEHAHSTMIPLKRNPDITNLEERAKEELVAELTAYALATRATDFSEKARKILIAKNISYLSCWAKNAGITEPSNFTQIFNECFRKSNEASELLLKGGNE